MFLVCIEGMASVGRLKTPRSPSRSTFESVEDSDEEGRHLANDDSIHFDDENIDSLNSNNCVRTFFFVWLFTVRILNDVCQL